MRFVDYITFNHFPVNAEKTFKRVLKSFFNSHAIRSYTDAILREQNGKVIIRQEIQPLIDKYWEILDQDRLILSGREFHKLFQNQAVETLVENQLNDCFQIAAHNPHLINLSIEMNQIITQYGKTYLEEEHSRTCKAAYQILREEKRLLSFHDYVILYFDYESDPKAQTTTLQQLISYMCFLRSIIASFAQFPVETESKLKALDFCENFDGLIRKIMHSQEKIVEITQQIEAIEKHLYDLECFYRRHSHEQPPKYHDEECCSATVSYHGIVSLWKLRMKIEQLKRVYKEKEQEYHKMLEYSTIDGQIKEEHETIQEFMNGIHYWFEELPKVLSRSNDVIALRDFEPESNKTTDIIFRYIQEGEVKSLQLRKQFSQKKSTKDDGQATSFEREKWFFAQGGSPGHSSDYEFKATIYLKNGVLALLQLLLKPDGQYAAVVGKENEAGCIGIHEDVLPAFNQLVTRIQITPCKPQKKQKILTIPFDKELGDFSCVVDLSLQEVPLYFLETNRLITLLPTKAHLIDKEVITEQDVEEFEEWYERGMTTDPLSGKRSCSYGLAPYSFGLQMSLYGDTLIRRYPRHYNNKIILKTYENVYTFVKLDNSVSSPLSLLYAACGPKITLKDIVLRLLHVMIMQPMFFQLIRESMISAQYVLSDEDHMLVQKWWDAHEQIMSEAKCYYPNMPSETIIQKMSDHKEEFYSSLREKFFPYFKFIESTNYIDEFLIKAYIFSLEKRLVIIRDEGNEPYAVDNSAQMIPLEVDWENIFILHHHDGSYSRLSLCSVNNEIFKISEPDLSYLADLKAIVNTETSAVTQAKCSRSGSFNGNLFWSSEIINLADHRLLDDTHDDNNVTVRRRRAPSL